MRFNLDFMPSPVPDRPGLLIRDSYQYSDVTLIIPPALVPCLECFDGHHTELDLRAMLAQTTGELDVSELEQNLIDTLSQSGFLEDDAFAALKAARHQAFAASPAREPAHAGSAYPAQTDDLRAAMAGYLGSSVTRFTDGIVGIAAPHVSPEGGWKTYREAYRKLGPQYRDRTFVILGTSHYGDPDRFGLTRKAFVTPYGSTAVDQELMSELAGEPAANMEDYCHAVEHSIEFQVLFLQSIYGPDIRILPILCGSFARSIYVGGKPEDDESVRRFLGKLGELWAREGDRLFWILGIDMAHMGRRYGDPFTAHAGQGRMSEVEARDAQRIDCIDAGDADGFWDLVQQNRDDLKWCGSSPLYTFMKAVPQARGSLLNYEQWNIDDKSVVSFAAMSFSNAASNATPQESQKP